MTDMQFTANTAVAVLGPDANLGAFRNWVADRLIAPVSEDGGLQRFSFHDVVRCALLLDIQKVMGVTSAFASDVARALTPATIARLCNVVNPEVRIQTESGIVIYMPDETVLEDLRDRMRRLRLR